MLQWKLEYPSLQPKQRQSRRPFCGSVFPDGFQKTAFVARKFEEFVVVAEGLARNTVFFGSSMEVCSVLVESGLRDVGGRFSTA